MYKVFIKDAAVFLTERKNISVLPPTDLTIKYEGTDDLQKKIDNLFSVEKPGSLTIVHDDTEVLFAAFSTLFKPVTAAGGRVKNEQGHTLFIFRYGRWDLPKGKIEKGENIETCAIREVREECGVHGLEITRPLIRTLHAYELKGTRWLKTSHWFDMYCSDKEHHLEPQLEEGITEVAWLGETAVKEALLNTYPTIVEVMKS
jgi:ADP-ribose pyrophosphatase YjhB (NUDIX family)